MSLQIIEESENNREAVITVQVPEDQLNKATRRVAAAFSKHRRVPGFRPGKAPLEMVIRTVGKEALEEETFNTLSREVLTELVNEKGINPYAEPTSEVVTKEPPVIKIKIPLEPVVKLGDYLSLREEPIQAIVEPEKVDQFLEDMRQRMKTQEEVDRGAVLGDTVAFSVTGTAGEEVVKNEEVDTLTLKDEGNAEYPPAFISEILGMKAGDTRTFQATYPEDFANKELAGKTVNFTVKVERVEETKVPDLDDEFAKKASEFDTLSELRAEIERNMAVQADREADEEYEKKVLDALVGISEVSYPAVAVNREVNRLVQDIDNDLRRQGLNLDRFLTITGRNPVDYVAELRPTAEERVKRGLVLQELIEQEGIQFSPQDLEIETNRRAQQFGERFEEVLQSLSTPENQVRLGSQILMAKGLARLKAIARGEGEIEDGAEPDTAEENQTETTTSQNQSELPVEAAGENLSTPGNPEIPPSEKG
ncbi:MAG: trigger factor [Chloroflexi bacterium]|nr:trigger factor [Chloroflexota bacterium]